MAHPVNRFSLLREIQNLYLLKNIPTIYNGLHLCPQQKERLTKFNIIIKKLTKRNTNIALMLAINHILCIFNNYFKHRYTK